MSNDSAANSDNSYPTGSIQIKMYNVGFGDCFLISFAYSDGKNRYLLIDCGSTTKLKDHMIKIVKQIKQDCNGHLHGLVITHRHKDHLSAFGLKDAGDILEDLHPEVVVRPWTEDTEAEEQAETVSPLDSQQTISHLRSLSAAQSFAKLLLENAPSIFSNLSKPLQHQIQFMADQNIHNKKAIDRLDRMAKAAKAAYVHAESKSGLEKIFPGIDISVLGPPTLKQSKKIKNQIKWDPEEFWKFQLSLTSQRQQNDGLKKGKSNLFPKSSTASIGAASSNTKWFIKKLDNGYAQNILRIVRALDNVLNNTSVILLFKVKDNVLLFPGDAQLENWQYALENLDPQTKEKLKKTIVYKVGHHGSTNATPRQGLWNLFVNRKKESNSKYMTALLSTESGNHDKVPRKSLVDTLKAETALYSTEDLQNTDKMYEVIDIQ